MVEIPHGGRAELMQASKDGRSDGDFVRDPGRAHI